MTQRVLPLVPIQVPAQVPVPVLAEVEQGSCAHVVRSEPCAQTARAYVVQGWDNAATTVIPARLPWARPQIPASL